MRARVDELIERHWKEASDGIVDCSVNELLRGQCTIRDYFVFKIDICNSTPLLYDQSKLYVQLMHPFFSTVDAICREFGADPDQTEYHGDSVLALFPERGNSADSVAEAALWSHYAFRRIAHSDQLRRLDLKCRSVLHFGPLNVAVTGPYGESHRVAVGIPIHVAAKREKLVDRGAVWASDEFVEQLTTKDRDSYFLRCKTMKTRRVQVRVPPPVPPRGALETPGLGGLFGLGGPSSALAAALRGKDLIPPHSALSAAVRGTDLIPEIPRYEWKDEQYEADDGWKMKLFPLYRDRGLPLHLFGNPSSAPLRT